MYPRIPSSKKRESFDSMNVKLNFVKARGLEV